VAKPITTLITVIIAVAIVIALIIGGYAIWNKLFNDNGKVIVTVDSIKRIAELATVEFSLSELYYGEKAKAWYEWEKATFIVMVKAKVLGSVDLNKTSIDIDGKKKIAKITFLKGAVKIHDPEIAEDGTNYITCKNPNILHPINAKDWNKAQKETIAEIKKTADSMGIREKTAAEAKVVLTNFLQSLGYEAQIEFKDELKNI
jgi:hypothetical protein